MVAGPVQRLRHRVPVLSEGVYMRVQHSMATLPLGAFVAQALAGSTKCSFTPCLPLSIINIKPGLCPTSSSTFRQS